MKKYSLVSSAIMQRVFKIQVENTIGTGFVVENADKKFLVTAKHLFKSVNYPETTSVEIYTEKGVEKINNQIKYSLESDVAVIHTSLFDSYHFEKVNYTNEKLFISQEVFMLGFPYGNQMEYYKLNNGYPLPLVKHGIVSGFMGNKLWIDWDNNQGFSGGLVVYRELNEEGYSDTEYIGGIISCYITHPIDVEGKLCENSGIGGAITIKEALDVIKEFD